MNRRKELTRRFRKVAWGRLYWRNRRWWRVFDNDDVAVVRNGTITHHYHTLAALEAEIAEAEHYAQLDIVERVACDMNEHRDEDGAPLYHFRQDGRMR